MALPDEWQELFLAKVEVWETEDAATKRNQIARFGAELAGVRSRIERFNEAFTDGSLDLQEFKEMKNPLVPRKVELEAQIANLEKTKTNRVEPVRKWILEANSLGKLVSGENFGEI